MTYRPTWGPAVRSEEFFDSAGSSVRLFTRSLRCSGCSASTLPAQPISRLVVSLPADAKTCRKIKQLALAAAPAGCTGLVCELGVEQLVMRSSEGCSARQSMYSPKNASSVGLGPLARSLIRACPAAFGSQALVGTVTRDAPLGPLRGCPSSMPITRIGICAPRSATKSNRSVPTSGSRYVARRTRGSSARGRSSSWGEDPGEQSRWTLCSGGSSKIKAPCGISNFRLDRSRIAAPGPS